MNSLNEYSVQREESDERRGKNFHIAGNFEVRNGKAFPLQAWTGPCGSRRLRLQNF
jgi:hypothetical protein